MNPPTDERLGLPSASAMHRLAVCPGSHLLSLSVDSKAVGQSPAKPDNEAAKIGTIIHAILAARAGKEPIMEQEQLKALEPYGDHWLGVLSKCWEQRGELLDRFLPGWDTDENPAHVILERRLWVENKSRRKLVSGQPDVLAHRSRLCVVIDYKTGSETVSDATENWQLRTLAACARQAIMPEVVVVAIVQPAAGPPTLAHYDLQVLEAVTQDVIDVASAAMRKSAPRSAGEHCTYCRARGHCKEAAEYYQSALTETSPSQPATKDEAKAIIESTTLEVCGLVWRKRKPLNWIMDAISNRIKSATPEELSRIGLCLKNGKMQTSYHSLPVLFEGLDLSFEEFLSCCSISRDKLAETFARKYGITKAQADRQAELALVDYAIKTECAKEIAEVK